MALVAEAGDQCKFVAENVSFTPFGSDQAVTVSFGGSLELAPENDWPNDITSYRLRISKFKLP